MADSATVVTAFFVFRDDLRRVDGLPRQAVTEVLAQLRLCQWRKRRTQAIRVGS